MTLTCESYLIIQFIHPLMRDDHSAMVQVISLYCLLTMDQPHLVQFPPPDLVWDCPPYRSAGGPQEPEYLSPMTQAPSELLHPSLLLMARTHTWRNRQTESNGTKGQLRL